MSTKSSLNLTKKIENITDPKNRLFLRVLGLKSLFFFNRIFIEPFSAPSDRRIPLSKTVHLPVLNFVQDEYTYRHGILMPRGFLKSTTITEAKPVWDYLKDHEQRILIANETFDNAKRFLGRIKRHILENELLRYCYPELKVSDEWVRTKRFSSQNIDMPREGNYREPTFDCIGVGGAAQSRHFTSIYLDDIIGKKARDSDVIQRDTRRWYDNVEELLVQPDITNPHASHIFIIGTHWYPGDIYHQIQQGDPRYKWKTVPAEDDSGNPTWPEKMSKEDIARMKSNPRTFVVFYTQYQNDPMKSEITDFKSEWLKTYHFQKTKDNDLAVRYNYFDENNKENERLVPIKELDISATIDPAFTEGSAKDACLTAIVIVGTDFKTNKRIVLEAWGQQISRPKQLYDKVFEFHGVYKPKRWGVEAFGAQKFVVEALREEATRRKTHLPVQELEKDVGANAKEIRIRALAEDFACGDIFIRDDMHELKAEYLRFPMGGLVDILDALSYHKRWWTKIDVDATRHQQNESYHDFLLSRDSVTGY